MRDVLLGWIYQLQIELVKMQIVGTLKVSHQTSLLFYQMRMPVCSL